VHNVIDQAKVLLRNNQPFVWNATHLSKQMRNKTIDLCNDYDARIKIVYLESPEDVIKTRNSKRDSTLTNKKLDEMLFKWEVPHEFEAHEVAYEINI
jgi:predicted kinase